MSRLHDLLKTNRRTLERQLAQTPRWWQFSPETFSHLRSTIPMIQEHASGRVIDLGCGSMAIEPIVRQLGLAYEGLDRNPVSAEVHFEADIQDMAIIEDATYDTALCLQVLEHVAHPRLAVEEIYRILKPGGITILSVPHLSRIHDAPSDFYRFTGYGIKMLLEEAGFEVAELRIRAGWFSFLGHQISNIIIPLTWGIPFLRDLIFALNSLIISHGCYYLDRWSPLLSKYFPLGFTVLGMKLKE